MTGDRPPLPGLRRLADLDDEQLGDLLAGALAGWVCTGCGCTSTRACPGVCWWVARDWCSACDRRPLRRLRRRLGRLLDRVLDAVEWPTQRGVGGSPVPSAPSGRPAGGAGDAPPPAG